MKKLVRLIKSWKLSRILTVFLAASLLLIATACGQGNMAQSGGKAYTDTAKRAMSDTYDEYDANQSFKGGMNGYNDDPRYNAETKAKTKALVDRAKANTSKSYDLDINPERVTDKIGKTVDNIKQDLPNAIQSRKEDAVREFQDRSSTLQKNLSNATDEATQIVDKATNNFQGAVNDAQKASQNTVKEIQSNLRDLS